MLVAEWLFWHSSNLRFILATFQKRDESAFENLRKGVMISLFY